MGRRGKDGEDLTENRKSDEARWLRRKWLISAETGQSGEFGLNGSGIDKIHCLNWIVLVARICKKAPSGAKTKSQRWGSILEVALRESATNLDLWRKEKKATQKSAQMAAWRGFPRLNKRAIDKSNLGVIGSFQKGAIPSKRLDQRKANWNKYAESHPGAKPNNRWKCLMLEIWFWMVPKALPETERKAT